MVSPLSLRRSDFANMRRMPSAVHSPALPRSLATTPAKFPANREFFEKEQGIWPDDVPHLF
jgi:hypothetical protein